ncbi:hypothetical protein [Listeria sp. PSOL-1]|uniref:hypothetical protein n=1 Tax=Listeria sp. PSOL-1 TaxID=1844999 RepID=UPI0013D05DB8|nr:hypothetical protein [Listeria sp. PSOL-1]
MKKRIIVPVVLATSLVFTGCGVGTEKNSNKADTNNPVENNSITKGVSKEVAEYVDTIFSNVKANWPYIKNVWPKANYKDNNLLLFYTNSKGKVDKVWKINTKEKKELKPQEYKNITNPSVGGYKDLKFDGKKSIMLTINKEYIGMMQQTPPKIKQKFAKFNMTYTVATHELFHYFYQPAELKNELIQGTGNRSQEYPIASEPRLYRKMLLLNLAEAYTNKSKQEEYLGKAKYWLEEWKAKDPVEAKNAQAVDFIEGQARYVEYLGEIASPSLTEKQKETAKKDILFYDKKKAFSAPDEEGYEIGFMGGILLDRVKPGWKNNYFQNKQPIADLLLQNIQPIKESVNTTVKKEVEKEINTQNQQSSKGMNAVDQFLSNKKIAALKIPSSLQNGSYNVEGFYKYKNKDVILGFSASFESKTVGINVQNVNIINMGDCYLIPLNEEYTLKDGELTLNGGTLSGKAKSVQTANEDGRTVLILQ